MDSLIYYSEPDLAAALDALSARTRGSILFTVAPRTPLLMAMWNAGKLFPRADRAPVMVPQSAVRLSRRMDATLTPIARVNSGFYISHAMAVTR